MRERRSLRDPAEETKGLGKKRSDPFKGRRGVVVSSAFLRTVLRGRAQHALDRQIEECVTNVLSLRLGYLRQALPNPLLDHMKMSDFDIVNAVDHDTRQTSGLDVAHDNDLAWLWHESRGLAGGWTAGGPSPGWLP
jgi:hypothetical protein